jgi:hypothetical protein
MASAISHRQVLSSTASRSAASIIPLFSWAFVVSGAAALVAAVAAGLTLFVPGVLRGPEVMNGSGRGTALVALFVAVPILVFSMIRVSRGSIRLVISWLGAAAYLQYNAVLFLFITPFNQLFLLYVAWFALGFWMLVTLLGAIDVAAFARHYSIRFPARALAVTVGVIAVGNAMAWLGNVIPAVFSTKSAAFLAGTGLPTNPIYVQDLSFWIPLMAVAAVWMWQRRAWGMVLGGAVFIFGFIESISIAVDQWMGSAADPSSTVASATVTPIFIAVALIALIPIFFYFRNLNRA